MLRGNRLFTTIPLAIALLARGRACLAQEIQLTGPLSDARPPAILEKRPYRVNRLHLGAEIAATLGNELSRSVLPGLRATYHFNEYLGVGLWAAFALHGTTAAADRLQAAIDERACDLRSLSAICLATAPSLTRRGTNTDGTARTGRLDGDQLGHFSWVIAPELTFVPVRGKVVFFNRFGMGIDATLTAGAALVGLRERTSCAALACANQFSLGNRITAAPLFGVGLTLYPSLSVSFGLEGRVLPFTWNPSGFDVHDEHGDAPDGAVGAADRSWRVNGMAAAFVAVHLPPATSR